MTAEPGPLNVVTGAFGYTGQHIARQLLSLGERVLTLSNHPDRTDPFDGRVAVSPFNFDRPDLLTETLKGASVLYNTYWVRFPHSGVTFEQAVENSRTLIKAAEEAGVQRIVHVSITNASSDSPLPYFRGKGVVEEYVKGSRMSYAIIRPTVLFGGEDVLINNIAWSLRRFPVFPVFGSGEYRLQPVHVEDMARIAVNAGHEERSLVMDGAGPEVYTFDELVRLLADSIGSKARVIHLRPGLALFVSRLVGYLTRDVVITRDEIRGLMSGLLVSENEPTGETRLSQWLEQNTGTVGVAYASELARHYK